MSAPITPWSTMGAIIDINVDNSRVSLIRWFPVRMHAQPVPSLVILWSPYPTHVLMWWVHQLITCTCNTPILNCTVTDRPSGLCYNWCKVGAGWCASQGQSIFFSLTLCCTLTTPMELLGSVPVNFLVQFWGVFIRLTGPVGEVSTQPSVLQLIPSQPGPNPPPGPHIPTTVFLTPRMPSYYSLQICVVLPWLMQTGLHSPPTMRRGLCCKSIITTTTNKIFILPLFNNQTLNYSCPIMSKHHPSLDF